MFVASGFCGAGRERGCFAAESLGPWGLLARRYQGNLGTKESMADGPNCKAHVWTVSKDKFVELCPRNVPFMEAVVLRGSEKLNLAEDEGKNFVLACKTTRLARDKSTLPNSQRDLLLNACINSTDFADFKESFGGSRDWSPDSDVLILAVSEDFSRQYLSSAGALGADHLWVKKSRAIPLQKVLVGITAEKSYAWAERNLVDVLSRCSENNPILVRGKSPFPLRVNENENQELPSLCEDLFVLLCEPVQQGLITSNTSIILSRMEIEPSGKINRLPTEEGREHTVNQSDLLTSFLISEFTNPVKEFSSLDSPTNLNHFKLEVEITLQPSVEISTFKGVNTVIADHCSRLYVTMATLMSIGLFNGTWVKVWRQKTDKTKEHTQIQTCYSCSTMDPLLSESCPSRNMEKKFEEVRSGEGMSESVTKKCCDTESSLDQRSDSEKPAFHIVQLFAIDEGLFERRLNLDSAKSMKSTDSEIKHQSLLSPSLFFNLFGSFCNMEPRPLCMDPVESGVKSSWVQAPIQHQDSRPNPAHPPFATDAHVALVLSPVSKTLDVFDEALTRHFTHSRLLTVGDVFGVEWDWRDVSSSATEAQKQRNCHIYFKVTKLVCGRQDVVSSFVDVKHTSLYQRGVVHSYAPPTIKAFDQPPLLKTVGIGHNTFVDLLRPRGLEGYVQNLCDVVKPYLSQSCTLPPTGILLTGPPGVGKRTVAEATARSLCLHSFGINCYDLIGESVAATETRIRNAFQKGLASSPCIMLMRNIHALGKDREGNEDEPRIAQTVTDCISKLQAESYRTVVVIAASSRPQDIPTDLLPCFLHEICMEAPSEDDRRSMLAGLMEVRSVADDISLRQLAKRTAGMVASDLTALLSQASCVSTKRVLDSCAKMDVYPKGASATFKGSNDYQFPWQLEQDICRAGVCILWEDLEQALDILQAAQSDAIGAPKIPSVKWEDVGGLANVKAEILDTVQLPLQHPELFAAGLRRSGVLLYGPPGTGKTLLAKAVATECSLNFLSVKGPELINMYVGQSEQNVREVFSRAQSARPCVIFFDELDSLAPNRGRSGDSGGVMDRVVSQLLAELDGLHKACDVFVIGATNRPDLLDPALLRPGRFDKMMYLGISEDHDAQLQILRALTRKFHLDAHFHLDEFVTQCPANLTGADFYALCSDAMLHSVKRKIHSLDAGEDIGEDEVEVKEEDFKAALDKLVPSVSSQELKRYQQLQQEFGVAGSTLNKKQ